IQKMRDEAKANEEADKKERESVDKLNSADALIFQTEKQLKEYGDKLPAEKKEPIEKALADLKAAHNNKDLDGIESATNLLNSSWQAASEEMYKGTQEQQAGPQPGQKPPAGDSGAPPSDDGEVTDVDFEEVGDDKK
ncbi:MAG: Hsp70 family protein, partial [Bacteroidales bacterium]|nr:Hsp70 family protein [Bacteroidales bacterium]